MNTALSSLLPLLGPLALQASLPGDREFDIVHTFLQAGPVAKIVLGILVVMSVASWTVMLSKSRQLRRVAEHNRRFLDVFRQSSRFSEINKAASEHEASPLVGIFRAGYVEIDSQVKARREKHGGNQYRIETLTGVERSLRRASAVELQILTRHTPILATTAAAAPFIGLFGTVWGIMIAFGDIGATGSASIVAVAPGIAEALVNTAAGLVAAVPALIGYNLIASRIRSLNAEMQDFALEFLNLTERNFS